MSRVRPGAGPRNHLITNDEFPLLDFKELSKCLQECDFDASEELVARPSASFMRKLFEQILDTFVGLSADYCIATSKNILRMSNPGSAAGADSHKNDDELERDNTAHSVEIVVFFRAVKMFLETCGIHDFDLMDLMRPDAHRTQRVLSGVVNFARFREVHLRECETLARESEDAVQEIKNIDEKNGDLATRIDQLHQRLSNATESSKESMASLHTYNSKLEQELINLQKSQEVFRKEHLSNKEAKTRLVEKLEDQRFLLSEAEREIQKIEGYASADPEVLRKVTADLKSHSRAEEEELRGLELTVRNKTRTHQSIQTVEDELRNLIRIVQEISNDLKSLETARETLARHNDELSGKQQSSQELSVHLESVKRQAQKSEEKIAKLRQQAQEKVQIANDRYRALEKEYSNLTKDRDAKQEHLDQLRKENSELDAEIQRMRSDFEVETRSTEEAIAKLNAHIRQYLVDISEHLWGKEVEG